MTSWKKLLFVRQPYPDNYVDKDLFLHELKKNVTVKLYTYRHLVRQSILITQHLSGLIIFICFFVFLLQSWISAQVLIILANSLSSMAYLAWLIFVLRRGPEFQASGKQAGKSGILFILTLLGLTPILKTLTLDTSEDTIYVLASLCLLTNALTFDYSATTTTANDSLALNAAIFASVMLASRLPTKAHVFGLMSLSVEWFALMPLLRRWIRQRWSFFDVPLTLVTITASLIMLTMISRGLTVVYLGCLITCTFICPAVFVYLQRYKNQIHGPWDEAPVKLTSTINLTPSSVNKKITRNNKSL